MAEVGTSPSRESRDPGAAPGGQLSQGVGAQVEVTVVEAPACHLCEDAKSALAVISQSYPMNVHVLSVLDEPRLTRIQEHGATQEPRDMREGESLPQGRRQRRKLRRTGAEKVGERREGAGAAG